MAKTSTPFNPWGVSRLESDSFDGVVKIPALLPIGCYWGYGEPGAFWIVCVLVLRDDE